MKYLLTLLTAVTLFCLACGSDATATGPTFSEAELQAQQAAFDKMMEAHDRVMPRMGEIFQLNRSLETQLEAADMPDTSVAKIREMMERLTASEDGMMNWMSDLDPLDSLRTDLDHAAILQYIATEDAEIIAVEENMNRTIAEGMKLIKVE